MPNSKPTNARATTRMDRNAQAILDSAVTILADEGWGALAFTRVAVGCDLSERPVRDRFPARTDLARAVWVDVAGPSLMTGLRSVIDAVSTKSPSSGLAGALAPFIHPGTVLRAARELLLVARFEGELQDTVMETTRQHFDEWVTPHRGRLSRSQAAVNAYAIAVALGLLLHADRSRVASLDFTAALSGLAQALRAPKESRRLPNWRGSHLDEKINFGTGDPALNALLQAAVDEVGAHGYEAATVAAISRASGYSEGALFNRYPTKRDLVVDATSRMLAQTALANAEEQSRIAASHSLALAQAMLLREMMMPSRRHLRGIALEQVRLAMHDETVMHALEGAVAGAVAHSGAGNSEEEATAALAHLGLATGTGVLVLADLQPDAWMLPFDVVTSIINAE